MIAGSQLSSIGSLPICSPDDGIASNSANWSTCLRLPLAIAASMLAVLAVAYILWTSAKLLVPVGPTLDEVAELWDKSVKMVDNNGVSRPERAHRLRPIRGDIRFFLEHPEQIPSETIAFPEFSPSS